MGGAHRLRRVPHDRREVLTQLAGRQLGVRRDLVAAPLLHDTPDELAQPLGEVRDWKAGECEPLPGKTMPKLVVVERDYGAVPRQVTALGPLVEELGTPTGRGSRWVPAEEVEELRLANGAVASGRRRRAPLAAASRPGRETILALSGTTNGRLAVEGIRALEQRSGVALADLAEEHADHRISFRDIGRCSRAR